MFQLQDSNYELKTIKFNVDGELSKRIKEPFPNKSFFMVISGKAGSGKTSLLINMLENKDIYKKVFDKVLLVQPKTSRSSLANDIFENLPEDQTFEKLGYDVLEKVKQVRDEFGKKESTRNRNQLLILDDVTSQLKDDPSLLIELSTNRRHLKLSIILLVQFTMSIGRSVRLQLTHIVLFKPSNLLEQETVRSEFLNMKKDEFKRLYNFVFKSDPHAFLFIDKNTDAVYKNMNRIIGV